MRRYKRILCNNPAEWTDIRAAVLAGEELDGRYYFEIGTRAGQPNGFLVRVDESGHVCLTEYWARHVRCGACRSIPYGSNERTVRFPADPVARARLIGEGKAEWERACNLASA